MRIPTFVLITMLCACDSATSTAEAAERQYRMLERSGSKQERCQKAGEVADAWLRAENQSKFDIWSVRRGLDCNAVLLDSLGA